MTKAKAALLHFTVSGLVVGSVLAVVFFVWYPGFLFALSGAISPVLVMVGVDLTLGPLLTFIVYRKNKPGLKFDLGFIVSVQLVALLYGSITLFNERPHFLVFAADSFTAISAQQVDMDALRFDELRRKPTAGPVLAFADLPNDPETRQDFLEGVLFEGQPDLERRTEFFEPYEAGAGSIRARAIRIEEFDAANEAEAQEIRRAIERYGNGSRPLGLVPARSFHAEYSIVLDLVSLEPLGAVAVDAWAAAPETPTTSGDGDGEG